MIWQILFFFASGQGSNRSTRTNANTIPGAFAADLLAPTGTSHMSHSSASMTSLVLFDSRDIDGFDDPFGRVQKLMMTHAASNPEPESRTPDLALGRKRSFIRDHSIGSRGDRHVAASTRYSTSDSSSRRPMRRPVFAIKFWPRSLVLLSLFALDLLISRAPQATSARRPPPRTARPRKQPTFSHNTGQVVQ
jgi:hypothetical protein